MGKHSLASQSPGNYHESVMVAEVVEALHIQKNHKYVDATLGNGGHAIEILNKGGLVLGIDLDPEMIRISQERLKPEFAETKYRLVQGNFINLDRIAIENQWTPVSGIIFDLGVSNIHLKDLERGFSFENPNANLDMRLDPNSQGVSAADLMNVLREDQLKALFETTLDKSSAVWLTRKVIDARQKSQIKTVGDMLTVCQDLRTRTVGLNKATLPFLALRIAVNSELDNLKEALPKAFDLVEPGGRLNVISFHSGEDKIVKDFFESQKEAGAKVLTEKPLLASVSEIESNRRARSAKLRILEK